MGRMSMFTADSLDTILTRLGRRLRLRDGWRMAQRTLWMVLAVAVLVQVVARLWPVENAIWWTLTPLVLWLPAVAVWTLARPLSPSQIARRVDVELHLKERLSTAWTLTHVDPPVAHPHHFDPDLLTRQQDDALAAARNVDPARDFPLTWLTGPLRMAGALAVAVLALALLPNPMDQILAERAAIARAAQEAAERVEELAETVETSTELTPEDREELARQLAELAEELRANRGDQEEALADFAELEEQLRNRLDADFAEQQASLDALAAQLEALAAANAQAESSDAADALEALAEALDSLDQEALEALARELSQLAGEAAAAGNAELAQALASLAQAAQAGDASAAQSAAEAASEAMTSAQSDADAQAVLARTLESLQAGRQVMAQAGGNQSAAAASAPSNQPGQNPGDTPGNGSGNNPGNNQGNSAGSGGGSNASTLPPNTGSGRAGAPRGEAPDGSEEQMADQVYVPWERRGDTDGEFIVPGQQTGQGETQVRETEQPLPGSAAAPLVPYQDVFGTYIDAANQALEREAIPAGMEEYVRGYFSQLEP